MVVTNRDIFSRSLNSQILRGADHIKNISIDDALDMEPTFIAIADRNVATNVCKWITIGNFLHKTAVLSSLTSFVVPRILPQKFKQISFLVFGCCAVVATLTYNSCWMFDPCSKYQVFLSNFDS